MSLINEALKKAQKQRTGEAPPLSSMPAIGGESASRIAKRGKPAGINTLLVRVGAGVAALAVVAVGAFLLLRSKPAETPAKAVATAIAEPAKPAAAAPTAPAPAASTPTFVIPTTPAPAATAEPVAARAEPAKPVAVATAAPKPEPEPVVAAPVTPAAPAAKMDGKAIDFIEAIRVAGIRASATDSKVLMNDRVYRVGDTVERTLGVKLVGITASSLTFEDEHGGRYTRNF